MEKTGRRVGREGDIGRPKCGRVALGEITNLVGGRDRRKPCVVKRVAANNARVARRQGEATKLETKRGLVRKSGGETAVEFMQVEQAQEDPKLGARQQRVSEYEDRRNNLKAPKEADRLSPEDIPDDPERTISSGLKNPLQSEEVKTRRTFLTDDLSQYEQEVYKYLLLLERRQILRPDYLKERRITSKMRQVVIDWLFEVQNHFKLCQESVELTVAILDRCLATDPIVDQENVQLVCIAAIFVATKYHEIFMLELSDLRYICDYSFKECEILNMERRVLKLINFKLNYALCTDFVGIFMRPLPKSLTTKRLVRYLSDLSLSEYRLAGVEPSKLACACLYVAQAVLAADANWRPVADLSAYSLPDVRQAILIIVRRAISVIGSAQGGVYNKHLRNTEPNCLGDIVRSESYLRTLKQIYTDLQ